MKRALLRTPEFGRTLKRVLKKDPQLASHIIEVLTVLSEEPRRPRLRTHKLKGELHDSWSCSAGYDLRIIFSFVDRDGHEAILLERIGTHDEVY